MNTHPVKEARRRSRSDHPTSEPGMCLREVRECFGVGPKAVDAKQAWEDAKHKHPEKDPRKIPRNAPVFWKGGEHWHVGIGTGYRARCASTDIRRPGYFDIVPIEEIAEKWGFELLGWTEDLNGARVYEDRDARLFKPKEAAKPAKKTAAKKTAPTKEK